MLTHVARERPSRRCSKSAMLYFSEASFPSESVMGERLMSEWLESTRFPTFLHCRLPTGDPSEYRRTHLITYDISLSDRKRVDKNRYDRWLMSD